MNKYKIFLASSEELKEDRDQFETFIFRKNKEWVDRGAMLDVIRWENFFDAMSPTRLQDEYNKAVHECDIFVILVFTKVGKYTSEEFQTALLKFKQSNKPLIYTYFKDAAILTGEIDDEIISMLQFKKKLLELEHFFTGYVNSDHLKLHFGDQLELLAKKGVLKLDESRDQGSQTQIDFAALKMVDEQFSMKQNSKPDENLLKEKIMNASDSMKDYIFRKTRDIRSDNWEFNKELMQRTIPVFLALIASVTGRPNYHLYGQLGFALKDQENPDLVDAEKKLSTAIELRGDHRNNGWVLYEFARALCRIMKYDNFQQNRESSPEIKKQIYEDLKTASTGINIKEWSEQGKNANLKKWIKLNKVRLQ